VLRGPSLRHYYSCHLVTRNAEGVTQKNLFFSSSFFVLFFLSGFFVIEQFFVCGSDMFRRLKASDDLGLLRVPVVVERNKLFMKSKRLFHRRFDFSPNSFDPNGPRYSGTEYASWVMEGLGDNNYAWTQNFVGNCIPQFPSVLPWRVNPFPYSVGECPWPVNEFTRQPTVRGGGFNGRKVPLECTTIRGNIRCGRNAVADDPNSSWDNVRVLLVFDLKPEYDPGFGHAYYTDPCNQLFEQVSVMSNLVGTARAFTPLAMARFRVVLDKTYRITRKVFPAVIHSAERDVNLSMDSADSDLIWNPTGNDGQLLSVDNNAVIGAVLGPGSLQYHHHLPGFQLVNAPPANMAAAVPIPPFPPAIGVDQHAHNDVSRISMRGVLDGNTQEFARVHPLGPITAIPALSSIGAADDVVEPVVTGPDGVTINEVVDWGELGYFTRFFDDGHICSGAVWLIVMSDNGQAYVGVPRGGANNESSLEVTTWFATD